MNSGSLVSSNKGSRSLLSSNRALQGAFGRIERLSVRCSGSSQWDDSGQSDPEDEHSDGHDDSAEHDDSST